MGLKRKPPPGNVRRVAAIGGNLRYTITSKANETIQCESFQERKLTLLFDRDPTIHAYASAKRQRAGSARSAAGDTLCILKKACHRPRKKPTCWPSTAIDRVPMHIQASRSSCKHACTSCVTLAFRQLSSDIMRQLGLAAPTVVSALCHLLWHGVLVADLCHQLIFHDAAPRTDLIVWLPTGGPTP